MIIIGEKISVMMKKVREALQKRDPKPIQELAVAQANAGAHYIDVSIGPAEDDGPQLMDWAVKVVHEVVQKPLCLDTTNVKAMEAGIKAHNNTWGLPIINSTSNEPERFPMMELAGKYGTKIVALTLGQGRPSGRCRGPLRHRVGDHGARHGVRRVDGEHLPRSAHSADRDHAGPGQAGDPRGQDVQGPERSADEHRGGTFEHLERRAEDTCGRSSTGTPGLAHV